MSAHLVWELCKQQADCENRIKELDYDFGADNFCIQEFYATEAALRAVMMGCNLMALFKLTVLQSKKNHRLTTIRLKSLSIGSWVVKSGRKDVLMMSAAMKNRAWMDGHFLNTFNCSWNKASHY